MQASAEFKLISGAQLDWFGRLPKWPTGADCKSAGYAFDGSNPSPTTILKNKG